MKARLATPDKKVRTQQVTSIQDQRYQTQTYATARKKGRFESLLKLPWAAQCSSIRLYCRNPISHFCCVFHPQIHFKRREVINLEENFHERLLHKGLSFPFKTPKSSCLENWPVDAAVKFKFKASHSDVKQVFLKEDAKVKYRGKNLYYKWIDGVDAKSIKHQKLNVLCGKSPCIWCIFLYNWPI